MDGKTQLLLRPIEVAEQLSVCRSKAYQLIQRGEINSVRMGKCVRVPVAAVQEYVQRLIAEAQGSAA